VSHDVAQRDTQLATEHLGLVFAIALRLRRAVPWISVAELASVGVVAFLEAIPRWEPERGSLATFVSPYVRGAMLRFIRLDRPIRAAINDVGNDPPSTSFDATFRSEDGTEATMHDTIPCPGPDPEALASQLHEINAVRAMLQRLPPRERTIISARIEGQSLREVGEHLGLSRERIRQVESSGIVMMQRMLASNVRKPL
jgi:RNA polymerase sigma factor (sigma-70 family)